MDDPKLTAVYEDTASGLRLCSDRWGATARATYGIRDGYFTSLYLSTSPAPYTKAWYDMTRPR